MKVIYEPKGRAKEYADLAFNIYKGCSHGCKYCYAPACLRRKPEDFRENISPRWDTLEKFSTDCDELACKGDERRILFSFLSDPYQSEVCQLSYVTIDGEQWCTTPDEPSVELVEREMEARAKRK